MGKDANPTSWELKLAATTLQEIGTVLRQLTGAIVSCGGWVLCRTMCEDGGEISFEFESRACVDMYTVPIAVGLELSQNSHLQLTDLCHCTRNISGESRFDIALIDLRIRPDEIGSALAEMRRL